MREREAGFSMIGMLVSVAIIGILATIAVPKFTTAVTAANTAKVQADLSTIDTAIAAMRVERGKEPAQMEDLKSYIQDYENLKPPAGKVYINGKEEEIAEGKQYSVGVYDQEKRGLLEGHPLPHFTKKASGSSGSSGQ